MAVSCSISPFNHHRLLPQRFKSPLPKPSLSLKLCPIHLSAFQSENPKPTNSDQIVESSSNSEPEPQSEPESTNPSSEVASELKQMLRERKEREKPEDNNLLVGVGEEVKEIEWPNLGRVVGTTGVVLAVIAGSTAVLLSVNALLAEISDKVFAGKGIQDFF